jgi:manganese transport system permease protein
MFEPAVASSQGVPVNSVKYLLIGLLVLAMISSLQAVGVILALGMLIAPAATIYLLSDSLATIFWAGGILGSAGSCTNLLLAKLALGSLYRSCSWGSFPARISIRA